MRNSPMTTKSSSSVAGSEPRWLYFS